jgi:hypothetical protein
MADRLHPNVRGTRKAAHMLVPNSTPRSDFVLLNELLGSNGVRVRCVLRTFCCTAGEELVRLEAALHAGDGRRISEAAHRAATACFAVGEVQPGQMLKAIASTTASSSNTAAMISDVVRARAALLESIARVSRCLVSGETGTEVASGSHAGVDRVTP